MMSGAAQLPERLEFELHAFTRVCWVSDSAKATWTERLRSAAAAWRHAEVASVAGGVRPCALVTLSAKAYADSASQWARSGLSAIVLEPQTAAPSGADRGGTDRWIGLRDVAVGRSRDALALSRAWMDADDDAIGESLGYPPCCRRAFRQRCRNGWRDHTWCVVAESRRFAAPATRLQVDASPLANLLLRSLAVRAMPHFPCDLDCASSRSLAEEMLDAARRSGSPEPVDSLKEILSWPVEWSALHGIAEIKTPLLKLATRTDATATTVAIVWQGNRYPALGAQGVRFPFKATQQPLTASAAFQRGIAINARIIALTPR